MGDKWEERGKKIEEAGKKTQQVGCLLTGLITIPILGVIFLGVPGLVGGVLIGGLIAYAAMKK